MKKLIILSMIVLAIAGCRKAEMPPDSRVCAQNFTFDGSYKAGRTFQTNEVIRGVSKATAIQRATTQIVTEGLQIATTDRQAGLISAHNIVNNSRGGEKVPYTVLITNVSGGIKVNITFKIRGGLTAPVTTVRNMMCNTIEAIKG